MLSYKKKKKIESKHNGYSVFMFIWEKAQEKQKIINKYGMVNACRERGREYLVEREYIY